MELLHFLKQKRSWQLKPLRLSIYLLNACKKLICSQRDSCFGYGPCGGEKWPNTRNLLRTVTFWPACLLALSAHKKLSVWHASAVSFYSMKVRILGHLLLRSKFSVFSRGLSSDGAFDAEISKNFCSPK